MGDPFSKPLPNSEHGRKIWRTRRANRFLQAVQLLRDRPITNHLKACNAAAEVSEHIASRISTVLNTLPRGYELKPNRIGEPALWHAETVLGASFADPLPSIAALTAFARDLKTGWLDEVYQAAGKDLDWLTYGQ